MNLVLIPDVRTEWLVFAIFKLLRLMNKNRYDIVISSHEPGVDHLLGFVAKIFYDIEWIGDFSDPMVAFYIPKLRRPIDRWIQGLLLSRMDRVLVTTPRLKEDFLAQYPFLAGDRIEVLPQGFDDRFWEETSAPVTHGKKLRLVYTGTFYRGERDPLELFKALGDLESMDVELVVAGRNDELIHDAKRMGLLGDKVIYLGYLKYEDSIRVQREGDVLVYLGNKSPNQVPGKIYEYLGARKPILAIYRNPDDEIRDLVLKFKRGVVTSDDSSKIKEAISILWRMYKKEELHSTFNLSLDDVRQYSWESLSNRLLPEG
jgi:hypothetical protein